MNVKKWKNNKFIENLKIKQYPAYPAEFIVFLCVTLFRQKMAEKRYTICILLLHRTDINSLPDRLKMLQAVDFADLAIYVAQVQDRLNS